MRASDALDAVTAALPVTQRCPPPSSCPCGGMGDAGSGGAGGGGIRGGG